MDDPIKTVKDSAGLFIDLIKMAGENPQVHEASTNLGQAALTISKTINNALLPLAAINFAFDKARDYYSHRFQSDLQEKTKAIPVDQIVEPKASVAGPALQGLAFTHEEPNLKEMYLSLLATAMDRRVASAAHPAFVEIIKQLESDEAHLLRLILRVPGLLAIVQVRYKTVEPKGWQTLMTHIMNILDSKTNQPVENANFPAMVDNWIRLGLVDVSYDTFLAGEKKYEWVEDRPEYKRLKDEYKSETGEITYARGSITRTALGLKFAVAVGLLIEDAPAKPLPSSEC